MPFLRSLAETAPKYDRNLEWPIVGMAYIIAFLGPMSTGPMIGILIRDWRAAIIGLLMGVGITFLNAWLSDRLFDAWIARFQRPLHKGFPRFLANVAAFGWGISLC